MKSTQRESLFEMPPDRVEMLTPVAREITRLNAAADRVLARLKQGAATNVELSHQDIGGLRFGGRLHELQKLGHVIEKEHVAGGIWRYKLRGAPETVTR